MVKLSGYYVTATRAARSLQRSPNKLEVHIEAGSKILFESVIESANVNKYELVESKMLSA